MALKTKSYSTEERYTIADIYCPSLLACLKGIGSCVDEQWTPLKRMLVIASSKPAFTCLLSSGQTQSVTDGISSLAWKHSKGITKNASLLLPEEEAHVVAATKLCAFASVYRRKMVSVTREDQRQDIRFCKGVEDNFEYDKGPLSKAIVNKQMNSQYRSHRYRLHKLYLRYSTKEEAMEHVPESVSQNDWIWLCDYFSSAQFQV
ncbi:hypothetical protein ACH5RR_039222 [Cinchona calisaya]|uniref:Uncharacterized protein n=1 Tax=Cinchona calisaya TaxID=153742 RepID=A0ABD2XXM9_9GENT